MKNFKRVISAVIALALSVSSFAAVSASSFSDVADTAAYAEAVEVLSALGVVSGYEDGTFKPEGEITRAEAATMIVGAMNLTEDAKASAGTSQFADVNTQANWATGYVNVGVAQGFISGMGDGTFAPQSNVTYAQMCVMLTSITGYGEYASKGGYPTGYTTMAAQVGINSGVSVSADTNLTRGQVAQMIYNALTTPMLGVSEYAFTGNTYTQLDGKDDRAFKTLLSDKFDGYVVTADITATSKTAAGLENGEAYLTVTKADQWDDTIVQSTTKYPAIRNVKVDASTVDADSNLFQAGKAVIVIDANDDNHLIYFSATGKTEVKDFAAEDYVLTADASGNSLETNNKIKFGSKAYTMATAVDLYVNGAFYATVNKAVASNDASVVGTTAGDSDAMIDKFLGKAQGTISLIKGDNDTGYSKILVTYYDVAKVTSVSYKNNTTTIQFNAANNAVTNLRKIIINDDSVEDGDCDVYVTLNDNEIELKDLQKDDIIAFATDMAAYKTSSDVTDPDFITVLVSRDTATGKCSSFDTEDYTFTVGDKAYEMAQTWNPGYLTVKNSYTLYLDPFGRIFTAEEDAASTNYAIVEKYTSDDKVRLVLADGTVADYDTTFSKAQVEALYIANDATKAVTDRVVEYTYKNSTKEITAMTAVTGTAINAEFKANTNKLGSAIIADSTKVIDASEYVNGSQKTSEYATFNVSSFKDEVDYVGTFFKPAGASNASFVILTTVGTKVTADSRFAVVRKPANLEDIDGDDCYTMNVLADGVEKTLTFDTAFDTETGRISTLAALNAWLAQGDAFYYTLNSDGRVDAAYKVLDFTKYKKDTHTWSNVFNSSALSTAIKAADWNFNYFDDGKDVQLVYGIVTDIKSNAITFAQINSGVINTNNAVTSANDTVGTATFGISSDAVYYEYDQFASGKEYDKIAATGSVAVSNIEQFETSQNSFEYSNDTVPSENINDYLTYALAMVVNGAVVEVYSFIN